MDRLRNDRAEQSDLSLQTTNLLFAIDHGTITILNAKSNWCANGNHNSNKVGFLFSSFVCVCVCVFVYLSPCCVCVFESQRSFVIFMRLVLRNLVWRPFPYGRYEYRTPKVSRDILPGLILRESLRHLSFLTSESSTTVT